MFLTASNLVYHLIGRGSITADSVVSGDFALVDAGRRNRNFKIIRRQTPGLFVKQAKTQEQQAFMTLQREAAFYQVASTDPRYSILKELMPEFVDYDPTRYALTIKLLPDAESLAEYQLRNNTISDASATALGTALGRCHNQLPMALTDQAFAGFLTADVPWVMNLEQIGYTVLTNFGGLGPHLVAALKSYHALQPMLTALRPLWQFDSLVHGDPKWDNCLITPRADGGLDFKLIDWELIDIGDGAWDVAMVFKELLVFWLLSIKDAANPLPHVYAPSSQRTPADLRAPAQAFWQAYTNARQFTPDVARAYLLRAVRYTAGRLVIAILEYFSPLPQLTNHAWAMLELSADILRNPEKAATELFGLNIR